MLEINSVEAQRNFPTYLQIAEGGAGGGEAVTVLRDDKPSVVIVSASEYARLKRRDKQVFRTEELPEWLAEQIGATRMDSKFSYLDDGV